MALTNLTQIRKKFRILTRTNSVSQISNADIDQYINTFLLYDLPEELRLFTLRQTLTFYTEPNVDRYKSNSNPEDPLFDFENRIVNIHPPIYGGGQELFFTLDRQEFYRLYPFPNSVIDNEFFGNGTVGPYTGTLSNTPILQNSVAIGTLDTADASVTAKDVPVDRTTGNIVNTKTGANIGTINYLTGVFNITFASNIKNNEPIVFNIYRYQVGRPVAILYFENEFVIRPVPDKTYPILLEVDVVPTELTEDNQSPELKQWWELIAYGAAKKRFEDQMDLNSVQLIMPEFQKRLDFASSRTIKQWATQRAPTIYSTPTQRFGPWFGPFNNIF